jgi:hypothetical protein
MAKKVRGAAASRFCSRGNDSEPRTSTMKELQDSRVLV